MADTTIEPAPPVGDSEARELVPGARLGTKYEIVRRLGSGGMAEIFLARAVGLLGFQKQVVIKRILPHLATQPGFVEMFLSEARIAISLQHPNIVQVYEVGSVGESFFLVMEYLEGEDLRAMMHTLRRRRQRLPLVHAIHIVSSVAAGLHSAHERRDIEGRALEIVHRDVTLQNVIVTWDGGVKLLDFGIAKSANSAHQTRFGTLKGKVPYMSPEQCRAEKLDRRSDVFSLGIMLYELSVGRRLFKGKSDFEVLKAIVEGPAPSPRRVDPDYPAELERIVLRALEKDRERRYPSARALQVDLEDFALAERLPLSAMALSAFMADLSGMRAPTEDESVEIMVIPSEATAAAERCDQAPAGSDEVLTKLEGAPAVRKRRRTAALAAASGLVLLVGAWVGIRHAADVAPSLVPAARPRPASEPLATFAPDTPTLQPLDRAVCASAPAGDRNEAEGLAQRSPGSPPSSSDRAPPRPAPRDSRQRAPSTKRSRGPGVTGLTSSGDRSPPPAKGEGTLVLASSPWCNVSIDGAPRGATPVRTKLPAGRHTVLLSNPEFQIRRSLVLQIQPNQVLRKQLDFGPP